MNPETGNEIPGPVSVQYNVPADLSQAPVANVGSQTELLANQQTTISMWTVLVGRSTPLFSDSVVTDELGQKYRIEGAVALRPKHRPTFKAAAARLISDMQ